MNNKVIAPIKTFNVSRGRQTDATVDHKLTPEKNPVTRLAKKIYIK